MEKMYEMYGCSLMVAFENQLVRIKGQKALQKFLSTNIDNRSTTLAAQIKTDYLSLMGRELDISIDSLVVEIWGHAYASYFARALKNLISLQLIDDVANFIIDRSDVIDCGEAEVDSNRKLWDLLAGFRPMILAFLPKRVKGS